MKKSTSKSAKRQSKGAMIAKVAIGVIFLFTAFGMETASEIFVGLIIGLGLVVWGIFPYIKARTGKQHSFSGNSVNLSGKGQEDLSNIADNKEFIISRAAEVMETSLSEYRNKCKEFNEELSSIPRIETTVGPKIKRRKNALLAEITPSNITKRSRIDKLFPFVVIDTETTGLSPKDCEIIEVSAIKYDQSFTPVSCFSTLCKPSGLIPKSASDVNNITDAMVSNAPSFSEVAGKFMEYIAGCNIVGHNVKFDVKFLFVNGVDFPEEIRYYDTLDLAKKVLRAKSSSEYDPVLGKYVPCTEYDVLNYKLDTLCEYYGIYRDNAHRSLSDCLATGKLFECLVRAKHDT